MNDIAFQNLASLVGSAREILVITGAGISAESGLPTYRGIGGLYENVVTDDGLAIEEALSATVFRSQPEITWKYLSQIERGARGANPNEAHKILARWETRAKRFWVLTQNVDGFHTAAGSRNVIEIHGNLHRLRCTKCDYRTEVTHYEGLSIPPACPQCAGLIRPDVVLFEEQLPGPEIETLQRELANPFELVISIGTSSYFPYITQPVYQAYRAGIPTIEINPTTTAVSDFVDHKIAAGAKEVLEGIEAILPAP